MGKREEERQGAWMSREEKEKGKEGREL